MLKDDPLRTDRRLFRRPTPSLEQSEMARRSRHEQSQADAGTVILGDEQAADLANRLGALAQQVVALEDQMRSQFTSVATYAAIATEQVEFARSESRADLDRTRDMLIGLMEQLRNEIGHRSVRGADLPGPSGPPTPVSGVPDMRLLGRLDDLERAIDVCFERQRDLAATVAAVFDTITAGAGNEPIADLALI
jgi:hypothetical protein